MGRPKGSKNKPKVTTPIIGEVVSKPANRVTPKDSGAIAHDIPINGDKMVDEGAPAPVLTDEEVNNAALKEAQHTVTRRRKLSVKDKSVEERLEFLFADAKSLRNYVMRLEDLMNVRRNEESNEPEPIVHRRRRKNLSNVETPDKTEQVENKESKNETPTE